MSKALAYQYMGEIARKQGDPKRALMLLKRALAEDPTLEGARQSTRSSAARAGAPSGLMQRLILSEGRAPDVRVR